jgi:hypothetical protein
MRNLRGKIVLIGITVLLISGVYTRLNMDSKEPRGLKILG